MYGYAKTQDGDTVGHIARDRKRSLCGVRLEGLMDSLIGWNPCRRCESIHWDGFKVGDLVWIESGRAYPNAEGEWEQREKPGVVIAVRGGKHPYRVRYEQKTAPTQECWAYPGRLRPREASE